MGEEIILERLFSSDVTFTKLSMNIVATEIIVNMLDSEDNYRRRGEIYTISKHV